MRDQIVRVKRFEKVPLILVGNKVDLESEREVSRSDGRALAQEWGCPFIETSAKSKTMVDELFAEIVRQMNYSTLPEKQEQCCTACVVQWRQGASISAYIYYFLCVDFSLLNVRKNLAHHSFYQFKKKVTKCSRGLCKYSSQAKGKSSTWTSVWGFQYSVRDQKDLVGSEGDEWVAQVCFFGTWS